MGYERANLEILGVAWLPHCGGYNTSSLLSQLDNCAEGRRKNLLKKEKLGRLLVVGREID